jgi:hypothetical protein
MKKKLEDGTTIHYDDKGNEIGRTGSVTMESEVAKYKSWVEGPMWDVKRIENEIRKYCYNNNIEIADLHSESSGFLQKTCYFDLRGDKYKLLSIQNFLKSLV